jgi:hypothetical protein
MNEKRNDPGGSGGAGGWSFQARVTAYVGACILAGQPLNWVRTGLDTPSALGSETGGAGDDLMLRLDGGTEVEVQVKKGVRKDAKLWDALLRLAEGLKQGAELLGVLVVDSTASKAVRTRLGQDLDRLSEGRNDHLADITKELLRRLGNAGINPPDIVPRLHVVVVDLSDPSPSLVHAKQLLSRLISQPKLAGAAWSVLAEKGLGLAASRGGMCARSLQVLLEKAGVQVVAGSTSADAAASAYASWILSKFAFVHIPGLGCSLRIEGAWRGLQCVLAEPQEAPSDALRSGDRIASTRRADAYHMALYYPHCMVVGGAGAGKTTLLRSIAHGLAGDGRRVVHAELQPVAGRLARGNGFSEALAEAATDGAEVGDPATLLACSEYLIVDGLDECGSMHGTAAQRLTEWGAGHPGTRIIASTRQDAYDPSQFPGWVHLVLLPLTSSDIEDYVRCLLDALYPEGGERLEAELDRFLAFCKRLEMPDAAIASPLLLGLLLRLSIARERVPGTLGELYERIVSLLEGIEVPGRSEVHVRRPPHARRILAILGFVMRVEPALAEPQLVARGAEVLRPEVSETIMDARQLVHDALAFWRERRLLVVSEGTAREWSFVHPTFMEFAAAEFVGDLGDAELADFMQRYAGSGDWDRVLIRASEIGGSARICDGLVRLSETASAENMVALAVQCFSAKAPMTDTQGHFVSAVGRALDSPTPVVCYETAAACLKNRASLSALGSALDPCSRSLQHWTKLSSITLRLVEGDPDVPLADVECLYDKADGVEDPWGGRLRLGLTSPGSKWEVENRFVVEATRFLLDRASGPETQSRVISAFGSWKLGLRTALELEKLLRDRGLGELLEQSAHFLQRKEAWAHLALGLAASRDDKLLPTDVVLLDCVLAACASDGVNPSAEARRERPLLALSALFSVLGLGELPFAEYEEIGRLSDRAVLREVVRAAIAAGNVDRQELADDAARAQEVRDGDEQLLYLVLPRIACRGDWDLIAATGFDAETLLRGLQCDSSFVAFMTCRIIAAGGCRKFTVGESRTILDDGEYGLFSASVLASELWGERAFEIVAERLRGPLTDGCRYLARCLPGLVEEECEAQEAAVVLVRCIRLGTPLLAADAAEALEKDSRLVCDRGELRELLVDWKTREAPYPKESGPVPWSPRAALLRKLARTRTLTIDEALDWLGDDRTDVREVALNHAKDVLSRSASSFETFLERINRDGEPLRLLDAVLDLEGAALLTARAELFALFRSKHAHVRGTMLAALPADWLGYEAGLSVAGQLMADADPRVRNEALLARRRLLRQAWDADGRRSS